MNIIENNKTKSEMNNSDNKFDKNYDKIKNKYTIKDVMYIGSNICISLAKLFIMIFQIIFITILSFIYICIKPVYILTEKILKKSIENVENIIDTETTKLNSIINKYTKYY